MPELPEVETVVRDLGPAVAGRTITAVEASEPGVVRFPVREVLAAQLPGHRVEGVARRGKYIVCRLQRDHELVIHLGMTGHLTVREAGARRVRHTHLVASLDDGRELRMDDVRRFGRVLFGPRAVLEAAGAIPRLGVEPLTEGFTASVLDGLLRTSVRPVKAVLLDQSRIAGLGNIYADEACHQAGVRPGRRAHRLTRAERAALHAAIPAVLAAGVRDRGTTFDDFRDLEGAPGAHAAELQVYGRAGQPCRRCGEPLARTVVAGRTTVYCRRCQR